MKAVCSISNSILKVYFFTGQESHKVLTIEYKYVVPDN